MSRIPFAIAVSPIPVPYSVPKGMDLNILHLDRSLIEQRTNLRMVSDSNQEKTVGGQLASLVEIWNQFGAPHHLCEIIQGYSLPFTRTPSSHKNTFLSKSSSPISSGLVDTPISANGRGNSILGITKNDFCRDRPLRFHFTYVPCEAIREITPACFQPQMSEHVFDNKKVQINQPPKDSKISASRRFYGKPRPFSSLLPCPRDSKAPSFSLPIIQRDCLQLDMSSIRPVHYSPSFRPTGSRLN